MDYALEVDIEKRIIARNEVSILVLMDYALEENGRVVENSPIPGFNPCSNGLCSRRMQR
jgi:hypothetical protein